MKARQTARRIAAWVAAWTLAGSVAFAAVRVDVRPGGWADVTVSAAQGFTYVRATQTEVIAEQPNGVRRWTVAIPEPILYLRAATDGLEVRAVAQGNFTGTAYAISAAGLSAIGSSFGQNATIIGWSPAAGFVTYVQTSPSTYARYDATGCAPCALTMPPTSQGFRDIQPDDTLRFGDAYMLRFVRGRPFWEPVDRGGLTAGQGDPPAIYVATADRVFVAIPGNAFEPHIAVSGATFVVAARTEAGAAFAFVEPPYPPDVPVNAPGPDPLPTPVPDPVPAPPSGGMPNHRADLVALRAQYGALLNQVQAGEMMGRLAFQLRGEGFGLLRKDGGNSCPVNGLAFRVSCDWILHAPTNTGCDVLGSGPDPDNAGPSTVSWCDGDPSPDPSRFVTVTTDPGKANTTTAPTPPAPVPSPVPSVDLSGVLAKLDALSRQLSDLRDRVDVIANEQSGAISALASRPVTINSAEIQFPNYSATLLGQRVTLKPIK